MTAGGECWRAILAAATAAEAGTPSPRGLCVACVEVLAVAGVGITLMDPAAAAAAYASDVVTNRLEELQFALGEGPSVDAYTTGAPVAEPDLGAIGVGRWVGFCPAAVTAGFGAVFSFPMHVGAARIGTLTVYRVETMLGEDLYAAVFVVAEMITRLILAWQSDAPDGMLAAELDADGLYQAVVHQASGMISVQADVGVGEALALLRARSFASSRTVAHVAADVVARRIRFDDRAA